MRLKIECTEKEKKLILNMMDNDEACPLLELESCQAETPCRKCLEENINWVITDEAEDTSSADH